MTIEQLIQSDSPVVQCRDIEEILLINASMLESQILKDPTSVQFPIVRAGRQIVIPRIPFLEYLGVLEKKI